MADARSDMDSPFVIDDTSVTGVPNKYDRSSFGLKLDPIPSYSATNGLKVYVDRETTFYTTASTTATTGFDPRIDEYLVINPLYKYAMMNGLANVNNIRERKIELERDIVRIYGRKGEDERKVMRPKKINYI